MAKYHIKKDGTPGLCRAKEGNCPLEGSESHFDSMEAAYTAAQDRLEAEFGVVHKGNLSEKELTADFEDKVNKLTTFTGSVSEKDKLRTEISRVNTLLKRANSVKGTVEGNLAGIHTPDGGATFNLAGIQPTTGFCASPYPQYSKVFNDSKEVNFNSLASYVAEVKQADPTIFSQEETYLGLWNDPEDGKVYLDISKRFHTAEEARKACEDHDQIAFFDLNVFESVDVDRNAKSGQ